MKESNIIENDNENTNIADKQIQLLLEMENGINGWQLKWNTYKEEKTGKKMVNLIKTKKQHENGKTHMYGYPLLTIEMPEKITDLDNQSKIKLLCSDGNIKKIKNKICEYQDQHSEFTENFPTHTSAYILSQKDKSLEDEIRSIIKRNNGSDQTSKDNQVKDVEQNIEPLNEKNKEEIAEHLKSSGANEQLEVIKVFGDKFYSIHNYYLKSLTKNIITWQKFNMANHNINSYENKLKFLEDAENSIKENNGEWKNDLGAQFTWTKTKNKNQVKLFIRLKPSEKPAFKTKPLFLNTFGIDVNDYKSKLQILYGNAFQFSSQENQEKPNEQEWEKKDIIDELLKSLSTPEKTFAYPNDGREGYRFVIKDNFVFLQRPIFKGHEEISDVPSACQGQDIDSIESDKELEQIITKNVENILKSCSNLNEKDKKGVYKLLNVNYDKYNRCCYCLCPSCCKLC